MAAMAATEIDVVVAYALPRRQWLLPLRLPAGSRVADAIAASGIDAAVPGLQALTLAVGIFGRPATHATELRDGDRVELYRPLLCDPKEVRRQRAGARPGGR